MTALTGVTTTSAAAAAPAAATAPATSADAAETRPTSYCDVTVSVIAQWSTGFGLQVTIRNISAVPVQWHRVDVWFAGQIWSTQAVDANYTESGRQASFTPLPSGGALGPGEATTIGTVFASGSGVLPASPLVVCSPS